MYDNAKLNGSWMVVSSPYWSSSEVDIDANSCDNEDSLCNAGKKCNVIVHDCFYMCVGVSVHKVVYQLPYLKVFCGYIL